MCSFLFAYSVLPQPAPIVRAFHLSVNTIITAGDATAGVSLCLSVSYRLSVFPASPCSSLSTSSFSFPSVLFNSYHYVSAKWNPLFLAFTSISIFFFSGLTFYHSYPLTLTVMGEKEKAPRCRLPSLFPLFTAEALTVLLLSSYGKMDTLTFHTLKCGIARYYL